LICLIISGDAVLNVVKFPASTSEHFSNGSWKL
jgi:hypothetical protein